MTTTKRTVKGSTKSNWQYKVSLNEEQTEAYKQIRDNVITILTGEAGTGKSFMVAYAALRFLQDFGNGHCVYLTRPYVKAGEDYGFLSGTLTEKFKPITESIEELMKTMVDMPQKIDELFAHGRMKLFPLGFGRGHTLTDSLIICDEFQNATDQQIEMMLGRLGTGSQMLFTGDMRQCDLKRKKDSGFPFLQKLTDIEGIGAIRLETNHRHPLVKKILDKYRENIVQE